jgi:hypothetical protein
MKAAIKSRKEKSSVKRGDRVGQEVSARSHGDFSAGVDDARDPRVPRLFHVLAAAWIVGMLLLGSLAPDRYYLLMQEDRIVEWGTVWLFLAAGVIGLRNSIRHRRIFDGLVALFCLFIAGEEFSWGQRLLGFYSPEYFLANNFQQEVNIHNLPGSFLKPKWVFIIALAGYGVLLPLLSRLSRLKRVLALVGTSVPPIQLTPWFIAAILLMLWYPLKLTGEWVELLAGSLFLVATRLQPKMLWITLLLTVVFGFAMIGIGSVLESGRDTARLPCAKAETESLLSDVISGGAATNKLWRRSSVHVRIWTAMDEGYLKRDLIREFDGTQCEGAAAQNVGMRKQYGIDPWGTAYWIYVEKPRNDERQVTVYSFGPNRQRDGEKNNQEQSDAGDDIAARGVLRKANE